MKFLYFFKICLIHLKHVHPPKKNKKNTYVKIVFVFDFPIFGQKSRP